MPARRANSHAVGSSVVCQRGDRVEERARKKRWGEGKGCRPTPAKGCRYTYLHPCLTRSSCCCMQLRALQRCRVESHRPKGLHLPHTRHALSSSLGNHSTLLVPIKTAGTCGCTHRWRERRCGVGGQFNGKGSGEWKRREKNSTHTTILRRTKPICHICSVFSAFWTTPSGRGATARHAARTTFTSTILILK